MSRTYDRDVEDMFESLDNAEKKLFYALPLTMDDRERLIRQLDVMRAALGTTNVTVRE